MDSEFIHTIMGIVIKGNLKRIINMGMVLKDSKMEMFLLDNIQRVKQMVVVNIIGNKVQVFKDFLKMEWDMVQVYLIMGNNYIKVNIEMIKDVGTEDIKIRKAIFIKDIIKMI